MTKNILNEEQLKRSLTGKLVEVYGPDGGFKKSNVVIPSILRDFSGVMEKARDGERVSETYRTEDGIAEITLHASKTPAGSEVTAEVRKIASRR